MNVPQWAARINATWGKSVEHIIETGRLLIQAQRELSGGQWTAMFSTRRRDGPVAFTVRTAQMLMLIARHPILSDAKHVSRLPPCWGTLYQLASIPDKELLRLIEDDTVNAGMERKEVGQILYTKVDAVAKGIEALFVFQTQHEKSAEWVAYAILHSPPTWWWHIPMHETLPQYLEDILREMHRLREEPAERIDGRQGETKDDQV